MVSTSYIGLGLVVEDKLIPLCVHIPLLSSQDPTNKYLYYSGIQWLLPWNRSCQEEPTITHVAHRIHTRVM